MLEALLRPFPYKPQQSKNPVCPFKRIELTHTDLLATKNSVTPSLKCKKSEIEPPVTSADVDSAF